MSVEPVFHQKPIDFSSPFKNSQTANPLSSSLDIENFQNQAFLPYKSKENSNLPGLFQEISNNNEEVLTTVTNFSAAKAQETANKKENDKKKWLKRI